MSAQPARARSSAPIPQPLSRRRIAVSPTATHKDMHSHSRGGTPPKSFPFRAARNNGPRTPGEPKTRWIGRQRVGLCRRRRRCWPPGSNCSRERQQRAAGRHPGGSPARRTPAALANLVHPAMRLRLHDAITAPHRAHFAAGVHPPRRPGHPARMRSPHLGCATIRCAAAQRPPRRREAVRCGDGG